MTHDIQPSLLCEPAQDGITVLTLNRPAKLNALSYALIERLRALEAKGAALASLVALVLQCEIWSAR
jgi:enoyl-CoA hydratase/carnithine racemase